MMNIPAKIIQCISDPLWALKDRSPRFDYWKKLEKTQFYSQEELYAIQKRRLCSVIQYVYKNVEYYRNMFDEHSITIEGLDDPKNFQKIPFLTKSIINENADMLISKEFDKNNLLCAKTGGSTGESLTLFIDYEANEKRAATARRSDRWSGWDVGEPIAALWGNPPQNDTLKKKIRNQCLQKFVYLDTMDLTNLSMDAFIKEYRRVKVRAIFGHAHSIYMFACYCKKQNISLHLKSIISTSMMLLDNEREEIEKVFQCKVTNRYGCEEVSLIGCECEEHNGMHLNIEHLFIEFIKSDGTHAKNGEMGEIVVTDLVNRGMPFIRYRLGDYGVPSDRMCSCGRPLPLMDKVIGRVADFLRKEDGGLVAGVSLIERTLTKIPGIQQMQIVQNELDEIQINTVRGEEFSKDSEDSLRNEFKIVFGDITLTIRYVEKLEQDKNGKYRFSVCNIKNDV